MAPDLPPLPPLYPWRCVQVFCNDSAQALLGLAGIHQCKPMLHAHVASNPSLVLVLEEMISGLMAGKAGCLTHYIPMHPPPSLGTSQEGAHGPKHAGRGWLQVQIMTVSLALSDYQTEPALFMVYRAVPHTELPPWGVSHPSPGLPPPVAPPQRSSTMSIPPAVTSGEAVAASAYAHMQLGYLAQSHAQGMVTIIAVDGRVLWQNGRSVEYMGLVFSRPTQRGWPLEHPLVSRLDQNRGRGRARGKQEGPQCFGHE